MRLISGLLLCLLIVAPWFVWMEIKTPGFFHYFFYIQQVLRFLIPQFNSQQPFWFYVAVLFVGMLPWSLLLLPALKAGWQRRNPIQLFLCLWAILVFVFFSIPHSKLIGYIVPAIPPLILLTAMTYDRASSRLTAWMAAVYAVILSLSVIAAWCLPSHIQQVVGMTLQIKAVISLSCALLAIFAIWMIRYKPAGLFGLVVASNLILFNLAMWTFGHLAPPSQSQWFVIKPAAQKLQPLLTPTDEIVTFRDFFYDLPFYIQRPIKMVQVWNTPGLAEHDDWRGEFLYAAQHFQPEVRSLLLDDAAFVQLWHGEQRVFAFVKTKKASQLIELVGSASVCNVFNTGKVTVVSNDRKLCDSRA
jgi:4-amino-4-deoxy-L-arabinose transferase-like glycosyltransferase